MYIIDNRAIEGAEERRGIKERIKKYGRYRET